MQRPVAASLVLVAITCAVASRLSATPRPELTRAATEARQDDATAQQLRALIAKLDDEDWTVRRDAIGDIGKLAPHPQAIGALIQALGHDSGLVRNIAVEYLGYKRNRIERAIEPLISLLDDPFSFVRKSVVQTLRQYRDDPRVIPALVAAMQDTDDGVADQAIYNIGQIGNTGQFANLIELLDRDEPRASPVLKTTAGHAQQAMQELLNRHRDIPRAFQLLTDALAAMDPETVQHAAVLQTLRGGPLTPRHYQSRLDALYEGSHPDRASRIATMEHAFSIAHPEAYDAWRWRQVTLPMIWRVVGIAVALGIALWIVVHIVRRRGARTSSQVAI